MTIAKEIASTIKSASKTKTSAYDTQAEVKRVEGSTAWVHIPGGVNETPVQMTVKCSVGDNVQVRVSGGRAFVVGNATAPPTDDTTATRAVFIATSAQEEAELAHNAAESAVAESFRAKAAADNAQALADMAKESADSAHESAVSASDSAYTALRQLSVVEDVVGVLDLVAKNGDYRQTEDTAAVQGKWYFTRSGAAGSYTYTVQQNVQFSFRQTSDESIVQGKPYYTRTGEGTTEDPYVYTQVDNPVFADIGTYYDNTNWGYYELVGIDQAIQNYVSSHLVLAGTSLYLQNGENNMIELSPTDGVVLYAGGTKVAQYGTDTVIGDPQGFHVQITGERLSFYSSENEVAYVSGNELYITQSVVLQQMDVGTPVSLGGLGQWSWAVHPVDNRNNYYLKWLG